tara:strand:+ start:209 stop:583 length:375 start_codon:yes stop_codon:yes gene_type:complete
MSTQDKEMDLTYPKQREWDKNIRSLFTTFLTKKYANNVSTHPNNTYITWKYYVKKEINADDGTCVLSKMRTIYYKDREVYHEKIPFKNLSFEVFVPDENYVLTHEKAVEIETDLVLNVNHSQTY